MQVAFGESSHKLYEATLWHGAALNSCFPHANTLPKVKENAYFEQGLLYSPACCPASMFQSAQSAAEDDGNVISFKKCDKSSCILT